MGKPAPTRQQVVAALSAVAVLLGGGGGAGYYLHGSTASAGEGPRVEAFPMERGAELEKWRAAQVALNERDRQEKAELVQALKDSSVTNGAVRDAVIALMERMGSFAQSQASMDARLRVVEAGGVRPAGGKR